MNLNSAATAHFGSKEGGATVTTSAIFQFAVPADSKAVSAQVQPPVSAQSKKIKKTKNKKRPQSKVVTNDPAQTEPSQVNSAPKMILQSPGNAVFDNSTVAMLGFVVKNRNVRQFTEVNRINDEWHEPAYDYV